MRRGWVGGKEDRCGSGRKKMTERRLARAAEKEAETWNPK